MKMRIGELRGLVREALGQAPTADQRLARAASRVKDLRRYLTRERVEDLDRAEWLATRDSLSKLAEYFSGGRARAGMEDSGLMLSTLVAAIDEVLEASEFWNRPSFLGRDKWERDFTSKVEVARSMCDEFLTAVEEYRKYRPRKTKKI